MTDSSTVSEAIHKIVAESGEILGSKLAASLRLKIPDWSPDNYGTRNLREFIEKNTEKVAVKGRSGMDVLYACSDQEMGQPVASYPTHSTDIWRAWVSPNSPYALVYDREQSKMTLIERDAPTPNGGVRIEPTTSDEHRRIAREFLNNIPVEQRPAFLLVIDSPNSNWWREWMNELKKKGKLSAWNQFRKERLQDLLQRRLMDSELDSNGVSSAAQAISTDVMASRQTRHRLRTSTPSGANISVRSVVSLVVSRMDEDDLRGLKLPVGLILDVLKDLKS